MPRARTVGLTIVFLWVFIGGIAHFAATETEMRIVPNYVPWPRAAVIVSGVFELLGAAGILWRPTRRIARLGLMALMSNVNKRRAEESSPGRPLAKGMSISFP